MYKYNRYMIKTQDWTMKSSLYEKEKIEYGNQKTREIALKMLRRNIIIVDIMKVTGLTEAELLRLQDENARF
jgi:hypothetical protein